MTSELYYKILKNTIDNLIDLSEFSEGNTYFLCGIDNNIINIFLSKKGIVKDIEEFHCMNQTKNGIILSYKNNYIILQKNNRDILRNKPLVEEFNIININELDEDL